MKKLISIAIIFVLTIIELHAQCSTTSPDPATVNTTQPTCEVANGTIVITAPLGDYEYNIDGGTYQTSFTFASVETGSHNILVRRSTDNACISDPISVTIDPQPVTPTTPTVGTITQPTCSVSSGSVVLSDLPGTGTWTLTRTPGGTTTTGTGTSSTETGLPDNATYTYTVTDASGCISVASGNVDIDVQPSTPNAPTVGTITQPTCALATGSVVLSGLPASGTWTLTRTPGGTTTTGTGTSRTVTGLPDNTTYTYTVTNASGCISAASGNVVINAQPATPNAPTVGAITQPTCALATGSVVLNGLPSSGTWTLTRTPGGTTTTGTGTSTTISGLAAGTYTYTVTNASGCISAASGNVVINVQPSTPTAPIVGTLTQPTCIVATGQVVLNGLPSTGTWTLARTPGGTTATGTSSSTTVSGLAAGTYAFTVTNAMGCTSPASANVIINVNSGSPTAPAIGTITHPTVNIPTGSVVLNGLPFTGTWTMTRTPGGTTTSGTGTSTTITGLIPGTYTFTVSNITGCTSEPSANVLIYDLNTFIIYAPDGKILHTNETITLDNSDAGSFLLKIESSTDWSVSENSLWLKAVKENIDSLKVTYMENISIIDKVAALNVKNYSNDVLVVNIKHKARVSQLNRSKFENIKMYPNPVNSFVNLEFGEEPFENIKISVMDINGNALIIRDHAKIESNQRVEINVSKLRVGQYFIQIGDGIHFKIFQVIKF